MAKRKLTPEQLAAVEALAKLCCTPKARRAVELG